MTTQASPGPIVQYGQVASGAPDYNPERAPAMFDLGNAILDPRVPFTYYPGNSSTTPFYGFIDGSYICCDAAPSTKAAANIAASQTPGAAVRTITLVSSSGSGITVGTSITNASTGATVTGLLAIDGAMAGVAFGQSGPVYIWDPTKAIARNIRITSGGNDSGITFTVSGYDLYGYPMTETITGANAGIASGAKAFKYIASVTCSGDVATTVSVGTGDVFGFPLRADYLFYATLYFNNVPATTANGFTAAVTTTATATTGDVRGTIDVANASGFNSSSNGTRRLQIAVSPTVGNLSSNPTTALFGVTQA